MQNTGSNILFWLIIIVVYIFLDIKLQITTNYCSKSGCWNQANGWKYYGEIVGDFSQYSYSCVRAQTSGGACKKSHCG